MASASSQVQARSKMAISALKDNLQDVLKLVAIHQQVGGKGRGRRHGLEVLNRTAILTICAYWEAYCEDLLCFALNFVADRAEPAGVPTSLQIKISDVLQKKPDRRETWRLTGDGWRTVLKEAAKDVADSIKGIEALNTPRPAQVDALFKDYLGVEPSKSWKWSRISVELAKKKLSDLITLRGEIAHRGKAARPVHLKEVVAATNLIMRLASATELTIAEAVVSAVQKAPRSKQTPKSP